MYHFCCIYSYAISAFSHIPLGELLESTVVKFPFRSKVRNYIAQTNNFSLDNNWVTVICQRQPFHYFGEKQIMMSNGGRPESFRCCLVLDGLDGRLKVPLSTHYSLTMQAVDTINFLSWNAK